MKVFLRILHTRLWRKIEENIGETQFGFRNGLETREALFSMQILVQKCLDQQKSIFICFVDYKKAFDNVKYNILSQRKRIGPDSKDINIIKRLYWKQRAQIKIGD